MKKIATMLLVTSMLMLILAACGSSSDDWRGVINDFENWVDETVEYVEENFLTLDWDQDDTAQRALDTIDRIEAEANEWGDVLEELEERLLEEGDYQALDEIEKIVEESFRRITAVFMLF